MRIRVLGCHGAELLNHNTCGFLINGSMLLDAGTVSSALTMTEQRRIRYILISHIHADHIKGLPSLSETIMAETRINPVVIISIPEVLSGLRRYFLNNHLWPDLNALRKGQTPVFRMKAVQNGKAFKIKGLEIRAFRVNHTVPCAGFIIREKNSSLLYSGDTYETQEIWKAAARDPHLKAAMIETSFPNALQGQAVRTKHLTPSLLLREFSKIAKPRLRIYVYHMKPLYLGKIRREIKKLSVSNISILEEGKVFTI